MRFHGFGPTLALCLSLGTAGFATPGQDIVTASLQAQGFEVTLVHWTWLGRIRIIAVSADIRREIVINPNSGEILRDYSQRIVAESIVAHDNNDNSTVPTVSRQSDPVVDMDASAVSALESMQMDVAPGLLPSLGQN